MHSNIFSYLPEDDREFIEEWVRVRVEKAVMGYSRFDRFLTFVERGATGTKNVVSGTANWVVETISKIGFHILIANVAYFGLTFGAQWCNSKTTKENEALTEQIAETKESSGVSIEALAVERNAALRKVEENQEELDNVNRRVKSKQIELIKANKRVKSQEAELSEANKRVKSQEAVLSEANSYIRKQQAKLACYRSAVVGDPPTVQRTCG